MQNNLDELKSRISSVQNLENVSLASQPNNSNLIPAVVSPPGFDIQYFGPTSTQYSANKAAQRVSQNQALTPTTDTEGDAVEARSGLDGKEKNHASCFPKAPHTQHLQKAEAIRLVHVYQHEIGQIYPLIDRNRLLRYVEESYLNNSTRLSTTDMNGAAAVTCVALAIALSIERPEDSLRETLFSYVLVLVRSNSFFAGCNVTDIITVILTVS
ncbi:uncharacterized protein N7483_006184 [Penicillium malachiteum]|uniref:uncharacterized protein n=1 Tax=Penicillium malachiteum TaxID=1324776 RepID=UPI0025471EF5|nr:uncharacterized protein N7483_006184 [Penicillium malachiteum]KAJ5731676.1 hypothetical protein N7483_006184 [Penicillium malachiteum]